MQGLLLQACTLTLKQCSRVHQNTPFLFRKLKVSQPANLTHADGDTLSLMRAAYSVAYLGFWKGGQELSAVGAEEVGAKEVHLPLGVGSGEASFPKSFVKLLNLMNENGVF